MEGLLAVEKSMLLPSSQRTGTDGESGRESHFGRQVVLRRSGCGQARVDRGWGAGESGGLWWSKPREHLIQQMETEGHGFPTVVHIQFLGAAVSVSSQCVFKLVI